MKKLIALAMLTTLMSGGLALANEGHTGDHEVAFGEPGDASKPARLIMITAREIDGGMKFLPDNIKIRVGEQVRFRIRNAGELEHEMVFATLEQNLEHAVEMAKNPDMEHDDPNAVRLQPGDVTDIVWRFTNAGNFDFSCLIPGHREGGMFGTIVVQ
ncbi:cupredoxin family protein [Devosia sp.]|uniref:cupredoxin domain-containing protein n=1 Tax=Devosia sp. TaxID=1871048 RepID=UPI00326556B6